MEKIFVIFQKPQQKPVSWACADIHACRAWRTIVVALQNHGNPAVCKTCRVPETIETCTIFARRQKPQQKPVSPQRASPVQEHVRTYMLAGRGEQLLAALQNHGNPAVCKTCRVPAETIETCTIFCPAAKILPTKRPPFWGPFLDPKTGAKSPGHKQIKLRLNEWTPFWGPFLDPKTGVVLSAKLWSPSEKKHKFRLFLHVRDRSFPYRWVSRALQRREYLFSTPCEHLCPHMFLNWGGPPWRHRFC